MGTSGPCWRAAAEGPTRAIGVGLLAIRIPSSHKTTSEENKTTFVSLDNTFSNVPNSLCPIGDRTSYLRSHFIPQIRRPIRDEKSDLKYKTPLLSLRVCIAVLQTLWSAATSGRATARPVSSRGVLFVRTGTRARVVEVGRGVCKSSTGAQHFPLTSSRSSQTSRAQRWPPKGPAARPGDFRG